MIFAEKEAKLQKNHFFYVVKSAKILEITQKLDCARVSSKRYHYFFKHEEVLSVFKGKNGVKSIFEDIIKSKANYDKLGSEGKFKELFPYYYHQYQDKKKENNISCRAICSLNERESMPTNYAVGKIKFLPNQFLNPATTIIYDHKVAIIIWKEEPLGVLMNSKEVANSYRYYFDLLWKLAEE